MRLAPGIIAFSNTGLNGLGTGNEQIRFGGASNESKHSSQAIAIISPLNPHIAGASYPAISLSWDAAKAAQENLEIATAAYSQGAVSILVLLDAQNAALITEQAAANAAYTFLLDHTRVDRAVGWFDFVAPPGEVGLDDLLTSLEGPVAIAFVHGDAVGAAKALRDFAKAHPSLVLKGGLLGERLLTIADVEALADVPPRDVLLARTAGAFQAPLVKATGLFSAFTRNLATEHPTARGGEIHGTAIAGIIAPAVKPKR